MAFNLTAALRLNDINFSSGMRRANQSVQRMSSNTGSLTGKIAGIGAAFGVTAVAVKGFQTAFQGAMQMETDKLTLGALVNDTAKANQLFDMLQKKALTSVFSDADFMGAGKAFLPITKDLGEINKLLGVTERLASSNPLQGMEGASFAIREALSGDLVSLQERFNIPRSTLKEAFKGADTATEKIEALDTVLNKLGFTQQFVNKVNTSASAQWSTLKSNVSTALANMGTAALEKLKKPLTEINKWAQGGGLNFIKDKGSDFLVSAVSKAIQFGEYIKTNWPKIKPILSDLNSVFGVIKDVLGFILSGAKSISDFILNNWPAIRETVIGITTAILAYKAAMIGMSIVGVVTNLINAYRAGTLGATVAQWALNAAMLANPVGLVIAGIAALIAIGVLLYRNWDVVKAKAISLFEKVGGLKTIFLALTGPIGLVIVAIKSLVSHWDEFKSSISNFKMPKIGLPKMFGGNGLIQSGKSHAGGLSNVPYNGYQATLHRGERVLTPEENDAYKRGVKGSSAINISGNTFHVRQDSDIKQIAYELAKLIEREGAMA